MSSVLSPPSNRVTVAVSVYRPHEPKFLPDMIVAQSASVVSGRIMHQARPFTQKGEVQENMASRSLPNDCCKILVAIIERQSAVKAHNVCTSAANIVNANIVQCMHDLRIMLRFPCNACTIEQLSCFHLTAALQTSCDNVVFFFFLYFKFGRTAPAVM